MVERQLPKLNVASSILATRSNFNSLWKWLRPRFVVFAVILESRAPFVPALLILERQLFELSWRVEGAG